jgi:glutaredoxin
MSVLVTMYSAAGCHLCDVARDVIDGERSRLGFDLNVIDISGDRDLEARYREQIPVVYVAGSRAFTYRVDPAELARLVTEASQAAAS